MIKSETNNMVSNKVIEVKEVLAFSGLSADTKRVALPKVRVDFIKLDITFNVTDAGISAGETFGGCIDELYVGNSNTKFFAVRKDEISKLIAMQQEGHSDGRCYDVMPTTATDQHVSYLIEGPFNLNTIDSPELVLSLLAPTDEFGGASAFTAQAEVTMIKSDSQTGYGALYQREYRPTAVRHEVPLGPSLVQDVYISTGTVTEVILPASDGRGSKSPTDHEENTTRCNKFLSNWMNYKNLSAPAAGTYWIEGLKLENFPGRLLTISVSSTSTLLIFAKNMVI